MPAATCGLTRRTPGRAHAGGSCRCSRAPAFPAPAARRASSGTCSVRNAGKAFVGDRARFATISPRSDSDAAPARSSTSSPSGPLDATLEVVNRNGVGATVVSRQPVSLVAGSNQIPWTPGPSLKPGSYILRLRDLETSPAPVLGSAVVRVMDVEATFRRRSALPGETVTLTVQTDAPWLRLTLLQCGPEDGPTNSNYEMRGVPVGQPQRIDLTGRDGRPTTFPSRSTCPGSGLYAARLDGPSGHVGFAPIVVRPQAPVQRVAIVLPTTTWHAYNYYDRNGDGFGDTWYSLFSQKRIDLSRPHLRRGVPERFRSYDVQFLHWLASRGHAVDTYADEDIDLFPSPQALRAAYDLIIFPGHTEYVTSRLYDLITIYRDLGGRLIFLSANNFFRHVKRTGQRGAPDRRVAQRGAARVGAARRPVPRERQRPATAAVHRHRRRQRRLAVRRHGARKRLAVRQATGSRSTRRRRSRRRGHRFSPRSRTCSGPGRTAEMTYYETPSGAAVFSAGVLNFGGTVMLWRETQQLLDNLWTRLAPRPSLTLTSGRRGHAQP